MTEKLALYGSYTRGLEATNIAPDNATNRGEAMPASITEQVDAGFHYVITPDVRVMIGVFDVRKPYLDRDATQLFRRVGRIRHRGIEISLSGTITGGLTVVAGAIFLKARASGLTVDQCTIGEVPPGRFPRTVQLNVEYPPPAWNGISVDAEVQNQGARFADRLNTFKIKSFTSLDLDARYQFELYEQPASLLVELSNVTNLYTWNVFGSQGWYFPSTRIDYRRASRPTSKESS